MEKFKRIIRKDITEEQKKAVIGSIECFLNAKKSIKELREMSLISDMQETEALNSMDETVIVVMASAADPSVDEPLLQETINNYLG